MEMRTVNVCDIITVLAISSKKTTVSKSTKEKLVLRMQRETVHLEWKIHNQETS